jgi:hypothetical protein
MSPPARTTISVQAGPQTEFLQTAADICIYGGAAGGGKTVGLIMEPLRYVGRVPGFTAVFFRRTTPQITNPGGLWDESLNFYQNDICTLFARLRRKKPVHFRPGKPLRPLLGVSLNLGAGISLRY